MLAHVYYAVPINVQTCPSNLICVKTTSQEPNKGVKEMRLKARASEVKSRALNAQVYKSSDVDPQRESIRYPASGIRRRGSAL